MLGENIVLPHLLRQNISLVLSCVERSTMSFCMLSHPSNSKRIANINENTLKKPRRNTHVETIEEQLTR